MEETSTFVNYREVSCAGVHTETKHKGMEHMGTTDLQGPSKRIRIVLAVLAAMAVMAAVPASGFAAEWSSKVTPNAEWSS